MQGSEKESGAEQNYIANFGWRRDKLDLAVHGRWNEKEIFET